MSLELVPLGQLHLDTAETIVLSGTPSATRVIVTFANVRWEGERLRARQHGPLAGDWLRVAEDVATLDIRLILDTDDGARLFVRGEGRTRASTFATGGPVYFTPRFETGDPRYAWLNHVQAVAKGRADGPHVTFDVFELK